MKSFFLVFSAKYEDLQMYECLYLEAEDFLEEWRWKIFSSSERIDTAWQKKVHVLLMY